MKARQFLAAALLTLVWTPLRAADTATVSESTATLTQQLQALADAANAKTPDDKKAVMNAAIQQLRDSDILSKAVKTGDTLPMFKLPDVSRGNVSSANLLKRGPIVLVFYRGGWCPYCNLQLRDLQKHLPDIEGLGARLVAISPQTPDNSLSTSDKAGLTFYVLSDAGDRTAKKFGLMYKLPEDLKKLYVSFGLDLEKSNGTPEWTLPLAATYVISREGKIVYSYVDVDYKKRAETMDIISALRKLPR